MFATKKKKQNLSIQEIKYVDERENKRKKKKEKKPKVLRQTHLLLPFLSMEDNFIRTKNGVLDIMQLKTRDLGAMNQIDLDLIVAYETRMLRSYAGNYKEVVLNFPANMEKQRRFWLKRKELTTDPVRLHAIQQKLFKFDEIERERTNREFFIFIYAEDERELEQNRHLMMKARQHSFPLVNISNEKKKDVLFLMNNQNTKLQ